MLLRLRVTARTTKLAIRKRRNTKDRYLEITGPEKCIKLIRNLYSTG